MTTDDTTTDDGSGEQEQEQERADADHIEPGNFVDDREDTGTLVVIAETGREATSHAIAAVGETVAELNPGYPEDDEVVFCAYRNALDAAFGEAWRNYPATFLAHQVGDKGIPVYSFPATRLVPKPAEWTDPAEREDEDGGAEVEDD